MIRVIGVIVFMLFFVFLFGQNQPNPFDLKYRTAQPRPLNVPQLPDTPAQLSVQLPTDSFVKIDTSSSLSVLDTPARINPFELSDEEVNEEDVAIEAEAEALPAKEIKTENNDRRRPSKGIQIFFLLLSLLFLIFIVNVERSFVRDLWKVISNENYSSLHLRNQRNTMRQILLIMGYIVFILQAGIFLYHALLLFGYRGELFDNVWTCIAVVLMVYLIRHSVIAYLRWLFNNEKEMTLFSFDISIFNIMVGLVLLPINVLINFGPENMLKPLIIIGVIIALLAYLMRQLRWMLTARHLITHSLFLFFIYLCAIEILPLWAVSTFFWW